MVRQSGCRRREDDPTRFVQRPGSVCKPHNPYATALASFGVTGTLDGPLGEPGLGYSHLEREGLGPPRRPGPSHVCPSGPEGLLAEWTGTTHVGHLQVRVVRVGNTPRRPEIFSFSDPLSSLRVPGATSLVSPSTFFKSDRSRQSTSPTRTPTLPRRSLREEDHPRRSLSSLHPEHEQSGFRKGPGTERDSWTLQSRYECPDGEETGVGMVRSRGW